jgi:hypothetical protein
MCNDHAWHVFITCLVIHSGSGNSGLLLHDSVALLDQVSPCEQVAATEMAVGCCTSRRCERAPASIREGVCQKLLGSLELLHDKIGYRSHSGKLTHLQLRHVLNTLLVSSPTSSCKDV